MTKEDLIGLRDDLGILTDEVEDLLLRQKVFDDLIEKAKSSSITESNPFLYLLTNDYFVSTVMSVSRLIDRDSNSISLRSLLSDFQDNYEEGDETLIIDLAREIVQFDNFKYDFKREFKKRFPNIPEQIANDLQIIDKLREEVKTLRNKKFGHIDREHALENISIPRKQLVDWIEKVHDLTVKYSWLIEQIGYEGDEMTPLILDNYDWLSEINFGTTS